MRRREARALLRASQYSGAYYLAGYSVECALKACVARTVQRYEFPDRNFASRAFTHELEKLLKLAGLEATLQTDTAANPQLNLNWTVVKDWTVESRYDHSISKVRAEDLYSACTARTHGVLTWVRQRW